MYSPFKQYKIQPNFNNCSDVLKVLDLLLKKTVLGIVVFCTQKTPSRGEHSQKEVIISGIINFESKCINDKKKRNLLQASISATPFIRLGTPVHSKCEVTVLNQKYQEHSDAVEQHGHLYHFDKELSSRHCKRKQKKPLSELRFSN